MLVFIVKLYFLTHVTRMRNEPNERYVYAYIQLNLVISNSLISNYGLSRSENLVPVLT